MIHSNALFGSNQSRKTLQQIQQPEDFHFHYEKSALDSKDQMSPTSTSPPQEKMCHWQIQPKDKTFTNEKLKENQTTVEFGKLEGNVLGLCVENYTTAVSDYLKLSFNQNSEQIIDFVFLSEFNGLDFLKQQYSQLLDKYNKSGKSTQNYEDYFYAQNSVLRRFLEEITYLNYEEINFEVIWIVTQMLDFKIQNNNESKRKKEFLLKLSLSQTIQFLNLRFLNEKIPEKKRQTQYLHFLQNMLQIISELYMHYKLFQLLEKDENNQPGMFNNQLKLFSSKRDIWNSDDEDDSMKLSLPHKRIKNFLNQ